MGKNPERFDRFNLGQAGISQGTGRDTQQAVEGYDWASLGSATVVDVGGGNGHISIALAQAYPSLNLIVQDLPDAVAIGAASIPSQRASRITFQDHDIFSPQPVKHADAYYLRHILHNWPDKQAIMILKALIAALKHSKSKVLISDTVIPPPGVLSGLDEKFVRCVDMQMMVLHNSRERTVEDFKILISAADNGLVFEQVWKKGISRAATLFEVRYGGGEEKKSEPTVGGANDGVNGVAVNVV